MSRVMAYLAEWYLYMVFYADTTAAITREELV
jgi:hypothetical protein